MSGRGGRGSGRGGRARGRGGRNRGRGSNCVGPGKSSKKGLCAALDGHVFDYGGKGAADQMRTTWEKLTQCVGAAHGQDIRNKLENKTTVDMPEPTHAPKAMARHAAREAMIRNGQANLQAARRTQEGLLVQAVATGADVDAPMKLATLQNEIVMLQLEQGEPVEVKMMKEEETLHHNEWRTYRERKSRLVKHRGQACNLIIGQCAQLLCDRFKQDMDWQAVKDSEDPPLLYRLIEKTILVQTEDKHPFETIWEQERSLCLNHQDTMTNAKWCGTFNTRVDAAKWRNPTAQCTT